MCVIVYVCVLHPRRGLQGIGLLLSILCCRRVSDRVRARRDVSAHLRAGAAGRAGVRDRRPHLPLALRDAQEDLREGYVLLVPTSHLLPIYLPAKAVVLHV